MSKTTAEGGLVQPWVFLASVRLLAVGSAVGRITPPPCGGFGRLQFLQALPFLGGHQDNRLMPGPRDGYRAAARFYLLGGCGQALGVVRLLIAHNSKYGRSVARLANTLATGSPRA